MSAKQTTKFSRALSFILRHGAEKVGVEMDSEGYCRVSDILKTQQMKGCTEQQLRTIVENCPKQRFVLKEKSSGLLIAANQGHSHKNGAAVDFSKTTTPIVDASQYPVVIHGTNISRKNKDGTVTDVLALIQQYGLSRRERTHIHMCTGLDAQSGIRKSCRALVYINLEKALAAGIKFCLSKNGVILSEGDTEKTDANGYNGVISPEYFSKIEKISWKKGEGGQMVHTVDETITFD
jgi:RNA:NAD 2'-phosphotransferase (TPT1/KptA family)